MQKKNEGFIQRNVKLIHRWYFESLINLRDKSNELESIDLRNILDLNLLFANFDDQLLQVSSNILKFWTNLLQEKDTTKIYDLGLRISEGMRLLHHTYDLIESK